MRPGCTDPKGARRPDHEHKREGVRDLHLACEPLAGRHEMFVGDNRNRLNRAEVVRLWAEEKHPRAHRIAMVRDDLTARTPSGFVWDHAA